MTITEGDAQVQERALPEESPEIELEPPVQERVAEGEERTR